MTVGKVCSKRSDHGVGEMSSRQIVHNLLGSPAKTRLNHSKFETRQSRDVCWPQDVIEMLKYVCCKDCTTKIIFLPRYLLVC